MTDSYEGITSSVAYALESFGIHVEDRRQLTPFIGPPLADSFVRYYGFSPEQAAGAVEKYREYYREKGVFQCRVYPGMEGLFRKLREKGRLVLLATSKPEAFARQILEHFHLSELFDAVGGSLLDGGRVRKAEVIAWVLRQAGVLPAEAVMVGDTSFDVLGAREMGMDCVAVGYGFGAGEELLAARPLAMAETVSRLEEILLSLE